MALSLTMEVDEVLTMSLDEYIAKFTSCNRKNSNVSKNSNNNDTSSFKSLRCKNKTAINVYEEEEEENEKEEEENEKKEEDLDAQFENEIYRNAECSIEEIIRSEDETPNCGSDSGEIWKGPDSKTDYIDLDYLEDDLNLSANVQKNRSQIDCGSSSVLKNKSIYDSNFDLRNKIGSSNNNNNHKKCVPHMNSQQWRLMRPNNASYRPAGMPPLVPKDTPIVNNRRQWRNNRRRRNNRGGWRGHMESCDSRLNGITNLNDKRIQKTNQRNDQDMFKNVSTVLERVNNGHNKNNNHHNHIEARNMTMEIPNGSANVSNSLTQSFSLKSISNLVDPLNLQQSVDTSDCANNNLRSLLGIKDNFTREEMPMLASKLLDFLKSGSEVTTHKPIYDIKIQKEIHEIQKKPLMYKCPGGEVVSSDGAGISNCTITPRSSGVTMNYRFA